MKLEITIPIPDEFAHVPRERWEGELASALLPIFDRLEQEAKRERARAQITITPASTASDEQRRISRLIADAAHRSILSPLT